MRLRNLQKICRGTFFVTCGAYTCDKYVRTPWLLSGDSMVSGSPSLLVDAALQYVVSTQDSVNNRYSSLHILGALLRPV